MGGFHFHNYNSITISKYPRRQNLLRQRDAARRVHRDDDRIDHYQTERRTRGNSIGCRHPDAAGIAGTGACPNGASLGGFIGFPSPGYRPGKGANAPLRCTAPHQIFPVFRTANFGVRRSAPLWIELGREALATRTCQAAPPRELRARRRFDL